LQFENPTAKEVLSFQKSGRKEVLAVLTSNHLQEPSETDPHKAARS